MVLNIKNPCVEVDYRNAFYQGQLVNLTRFGFGILLTDNHCFFIGNWDNNELKGSYCFLSPKTKAFGEINERKLQNFNVIESEGKIIYGNYDNGLLEGIGIIITKQSCIVNSYNRGILINKVETYSSSRQIKQRILSQYFPENFHTFQDYLAGLLDDPDIVDNKISCKRIVLGNKQIYYGFCDLQDNARGLGLIFKNNLIHSIGQYKNNKLHGLGRININREQFHDGEFANGLLTGTGIKYNQTTNTFLFGSFNIEDKKWQKRHGYPNKEILQIRRYYHLQASTFVDETIVGQLLLKLNLLKLYSINSQRVNSPLRKSQNLKFMKNMTLTIKDSDDSLLTSGFKSVKYSNAKVYPQDFKKQKKLNINNYNPQDVLQTNKMQKYSETPKANKNYVTPFKYKNNPESEQKNNMNQSQQLKNYYTSNQYFNKEQLKKKPEMKKWNQKQYSENQKSENSNNIKSAIYDYNDLPKNYYQQPNEKKFQQNDYYKKSLTQRDNKYFQQKKQYSIKNYHHQQKKQKPLDNVKEQQESQNLRQSEFQKNDLYKQYESVNSQIESKLQILKKSKMVQQFLYQQQKINLSNSSNSQLIKKQQKNITFKNSVVEKSPLTQQMVSKYILIFIRQIKGSKSQLESLYSQLQKIIDQIFKKGGWLNKTSISILNNKHEILFELRSNDYQANWISSKKYHIYVGEIFYEEAWNKQKSSVQKYLFMKGKARASLIEISQK